MEDVNDTRTVKKTLDVVLSDDESSSCLSKSSCSEQIKKIAEDEKAKSKSVPSKKEKIKPDYIDFFENFEILEMHTSKSMIVRCNKLNGGVFMLKQISDHKDLLEGYIDSFKGEKKKLDGYLN